MGERNRALPDAEKQKKLDNAVAAIRAQLKPSLDKGMKDADLKRQLGALKRQHDLTSLNLGKQGASFEITATVNPSKNVLKGFTPLERHVLKVANEVGEEVMNDPRVRAAQARLAQQRQSGRGSTPAAPVQVGQGEHYAAGQDLRSGVGSRRRSQQTYYEVNGQVVKQTQSYRHDVQTVGTLEVQIKGGGSYPAIAGTMERMKQAVLRSDPTLSPARAEREVAELIRRSASGQLSGPLAAQFKDELAQVTHLLFTVEPARNNSAASFSLMLVESISRGTLTFDEAFTGRKDGRGLYPPSQQGAVAAMNRVDRELGLDEATLSREGQSTSGKWLEQRDRQLEFCKRWIQQRMRGLAMDFDDEASFRQYVTTHYKADLLQAVLQYMK